MEVQPEVDKISPIMNTITNLQDQITAERARLEKAESMHSDLVQGRREYENKVNQLIADAKQTHDAAHASTNQIGIGSQSRATLDSKMDCQRQT